MQRSLDVFANDVTVDHVVYPNVRLMVIDGEAVVFGITDGTPTVLARATVTAPFDQWRARELETDTGTWAFRRGWCGCGSPLKQLRPLLSLVGAE